MTITDMNDVSVLVRREIEASIAGPLIRAFAESCGRAETLATVGRVIDDLAFEGGRALAEKMGGDSLVDLARGLEAWQAGGAYDMDVLESSDRVYRFNITRCMYVDMYERLGLRDLGVILSCRRDYKLVEGFNPGLKLDRSRTIMAGDGVCDFTISLAEGDR